MEKEKKNGRMITEVMSAVEGIGSCQLLPRLFLAVICKSLKLTRSPLTGRSLSKFPSHTPVISDNATTTGIAFWRLIR